MKPRILKINSSFGFTLLEVLLGIGIFSIVIVALYSVFWSGTRLSYYSNQQGKLYREVRWLLSLLGDELENTVHYDFSSSYPDKKAFVGEHEKITFLNSSDKGLRAVSYHLETSSSDKVHRVLIGRTYTKNVDIHLTSQSDGATYYLVREEKPFLDFVDDITDENTETEIVASQIEPNGLKFFYGVNEGQGNAQVSWSEEWDREGIPAQVRAEVTFLIPNDGDKNTAVTFDKSIFIPHGILGNEKAENQGEGANTPQPENE